MAAGISRKELKRDEVVEATLGAGEWIEQHGRTALVLGAAALIAVLGYFGWRAYHERREERAATTLAEGEKAYRDAEKAGFTKSDLERALSSFADAQQRGRSTAAGRLATYWHAASLLRLGRAAEAATELEPLWKDPATPPTLAGSAKALAADAVAAAGDKDRAAALLEELASAEPEIFPADQALQSLAWLREKSGDTAGARQAWQRILDRFPERPTASEAREHLGS